MGKPKPLDSRGITAYQKTMGKAVPEENGAGGKIPDGAFLKTERQKVRPSTHGRPAPAPQKRELSKARRLAMFMVLIGSDEAAAILSRLDPGQVEAVSKEIVSVKSISPEEAGAVLEEFRSLLSPSFGYRGAASGGVEEARRLLYAAFGPEKGEALLVRAVPEAAEKPFDFLTDFSGEQVALLFKDESPAACAVVYSRLPSKLSAAALAGTSPAKKLEIVKRIARLKDMSPEVIQRTAAALREKARHLGRDDSVREIDGKNVLAAILKQSGPDFGGRLLEELEDDDPSLGREMKDRLYTLEDVCGAEDRPLQEKLRSMGDRDVALLLRDRTENFTGKIYGNLSSARARRIKEESEILGPVPKIETEAAARDFLAWFRLNREEGRILMLGDKDVLV